ncbi:MAG: hypothetical protein A2231_09835 [Candidatus Firestonebacteria bacterium RIFOXYA2_FULL_40_8]|nr:MAG: hypothetical protein A2231_09835 [Candidatus Firestonebacteria bacterium RIFOXYA2_FULL_40_8]
MTKAGFSKVDITKAFTYKACGYKVNDPLYARCFVLVQNDKTQQLTFSLDYVDFPEPLVTDYRRRIAKALGINPGKIVIHSTHAHSVPSLANLNPDHLVKLLIATAKKAVNKSCITSTAFIKTEAGKGFNLNRRWDSKKNLGTVTVIDNNGCTFKNGTAYVKDYVKNELKALGFPKINVSASAKLDGTLDPDLTMLLFKNNHGKITGGIVRYASHPTFVAHFQGNIISSDYPAFLLKALEKHFGGDFIFLNGCSGDLRPCSKNYTCKGAEYFGKILAKKLIRASKSPIFSPLTKAVYSTKKIGLKTRRDFEKDINKLTANFWLLREKNTPGSLSKMPIKKAREKDALRWINDYLIYMNFTIFKGNKTFITRKYWPYELGILSLGPVNYVFFQEEVFSKMTTYIKNHYPEMNLNTVAHSNGCSFYLVPNNEIKKGGYEYTASIFEKGAFEVVQNNVRKLISKCIPGKLS